MKSTLLLYLIICAYCRSIFNATQCLLNHPKFEDEAYNIYTAAQSKDFWTIFKTGITAFFRFKEILEKECIIEDEDIFKKELFTNNQVKIIQSLIKNAKFEDSPKY